MNFIVASDEEYDAFVFSSCYVMLGKSVRSWPLGKTFTQSGTTSLLQTKVISGVHTHDKCFFVFFHQFQMET